MLPLTHVPQHGYTVLATRGTQRAVRGNRYSIQHRRMAYKVGRELAGCQTPDLMSQLHSNKVAW